MSNSQAERDAQGIPRNHLIAGHYGKGGKTGSNQDAKPEVWEIPPYKKREKPKLKGSPFGSITGNNAPHTSVAHSRYRKGAAK
jgi:hypothetical protein